MSKPNKFREAYDRHLREQPGLRYKSHPDSIFTWSHPSLIELGRKFHNEWFGRGFRGVLPRRTQLIDIANELLTHLDAPGDIVVPDDGTISPALLEYARTAEANASDAKTYHIALAMYCAIQIVHSGEPLEDKHFVGGMVYGPLLILEGLLLAGRTVAMQKKTPLPDAPELRRMYDEYTKGGGDPAKWTATLASKYHRDVRTVQRRWKAAQAT